MSTPYGLTIRKPHYIFADIIDIDDRTVKEYVDKNNVGEGEDLLVDLYAIGSGDVVFRGIIQYDSNETILGMIKNKVIKDKEEKLTLIESIDLEVG